MVRSSKSATAEHRNEILDVAARKVKQEGVGAVTIPGVMREAGMTPGGFYTHFESKLDLTELAMRHAFEVQRGLLRSLSTEWQGDHRGGRDALAEMYITRVDPEKIGLGCPISALAGDVARSPLDSPLRPAWISELRQNIAVMASLGEHEGDTSPRQRAETLVRLATLIGTAVLARATAGDPLSDEIRKAVRASLSDTE